MLKRIGLPYPYLAFLAWSFVTIAWAPEPKVSLGRFLPVVLIVSALAAMVGRMRSSRDVHVCLDWYLRACAGLVWLNALAELLFPHTVSFDSTWGAYAWSMSWENNERVSQIVRFCGFLGDPNAIGALMMVTVLTATLQLSTAPKVKWRRLLILTMFVSVLEGAASDSRTSFVCMLAGLGVWAAWRYGIRGKIALLGIVLALVALKSSHNPYIDRGISDLNGRTMLAAFEIGKIKEHPLAGYGYAIEGRLVAEDRHFGDWSVAFEDPHASLQNGYLSVIVAVGLPAFLLWLFAFLRPWIFLAGRHEHNHLLKASFFLIIVPALIFAMSESGISEPRDPLGLLVFTVWLVAERYRVTHLAVPVPLVAQAHRFYLAGAAK